MRIEARLENLVRRLDEDRTLMRIEGKFDELRLHPQEDPVPARIEAKLDELVQRLNQDRAAARIEAKLDELVQGLNQDRAAARIESKLEELAQLLKDENRSHNAVRSILEHDVRPVLVAIVRDDAGHRRSLQRLRATAEYEIAYTDPNPLVTVTLATRGDRLDLLMNRAIPSALAQTHSRLEVVVVGDAAGEPTRAAIESLRDPRIRFFDLTQRFVHPVAYRHWLTAATLSRNEAYHRAEGRWIADLDDDDALRPDAVERLLNLARKHRLEVAYGTLERHHPTGEKIIIGTFPPRLLEESKQVAPYQIWEGRASCGALAHAGMRMFAREHVAADIGQPGDFYRVERMVRAGVRFGMLEDIVYDYYPSSLWHR